MATHSRIGLELFEEDPAQVVVDEEQHHQRELGVHPGRAEVIAWAAGDKPGAKRDGGHCRGSHDAPEKFRLHNGEAVLAGLVFTHGVIDEESRQIEDGAKPADDGHNMEGFDPKHKVVSRRVGGAATAGLRD